MNTTKFYGLTGGIGAGKSTAANMFKAFGVPTLDLDSVGKSLHNEKQIQAQLIQAFGQDIIKNNIVDLKKLRNKVFASNTAISKLNAIMHPAIIQAEQVWRNKQTSAFAAIEASVLIESGGVKRMDGLIVVLADLNIRKARVLKRGNQDEAMFHAIIKQQTSDEVRMQAANHLLYNNYDLQSLEKDVYQLHQLLNAQQ